jgi:hypothetical protein
VIFHMSLLGVIRVASCHFVDRSLGWEMKNDPRSHTNGHEIGNDNREMENLSVLETKR